MLIPYGQHADQLIENFPGDQRKPTLVLIHGGYWREKHDREHFRPIAVALNNLGWEVALVEYRRIPGNPDATIEDINKVFNSITNESIVIGYSAGGQLALVTHANHPNILKIIGLAPVTDLAKTQELGLGEGAVAAWLGGIERNDLDPNLLATPKIPITFIQGDSDERLPISVTRKYATKNAISLIELPALGHFDLLKTDGPSWEAILSALTD